MLNKALRTLNEAVRDRAFPGGQIAVWRDGENAFVHAGRLSYAPSSFDVSDETIYDLASVTKVVATTAMAMIYVAQERLRLEDRVGSFFEEIADARLADATMRQLLSHDAGFPAWRPLYETVPAEIFGSTQAKPSLLRSMLSTSLERDPGAGPVYSDLDMMLLGFIVEKIGDRPLDSLVRSHVLEPLGMTEVDYRPTENLPNHFVAPTRRCELRGMTMLGRPDDENTDCAGGVLGQSGLFGTAKGLAAFGVEILRALDDRGEIFERDVVETFTRRAFPESNHGFGLGFDGRSPAGSLLPDAMGPRSVGHWGYTGTGLWIDPDARLVVTLLTNRVHPDRSNERIRFWRPRLIKAAL